MSLNPDFQWQPISTRGFLTGPLKAVGRFIRALNQRMQQLTTITEVTDFRETESRTSGQITIFTEEFDSAGYGWVQSGRITVITPTLITQLFAEYLGSGNSTLHGSYKYDKDVFVWNNAWAFDDTTGDPRAAFANFTDGDATPDVDGRVCWRTVNTSGTTITAFNHTNNADTLKHLFVLLIDDDNTTIDFSQSGLEGNNGVSWKGKSGDVLLCVRMGGNTPVTVCLVPSQEVAGAEVKGGSVLTLENVATTVVTHGMAGTPTAVAITPANANASTWEDSLTPYISAITSTTFTITFGGTLTGSIGGHDWYWTATVNP